MKGLMQNQPLLLSSLLAHADRFHGHTEIVSRTVEGPIHRYGYREAAQDHCRGYHKIARITSVKARYGDYVGFACEFPRNYDPVGHGDWWMKPMFGIF